jgi:DNA-binding PadR family transcriptional regulator
MVKHTVGQNEALILAGLRATDESTIAQIAERVEPARTIGDGSIYIALQRMTARGLVTVRKVRATSPDGRERSIGLYAITGEGSRALQSWERDAERVRHLRAYPGIA